MISLALSPLRTLPPPAFSDAAGAQAWLVQQKRSPGRYFDAAIEQLERLQGLTDQGFVRAQILEVLRQPTLQALAENRPRFAWQPRPLQVIGSAALSSNLRLWSALITGYMQCAEEIAATPGTDPTWVAVATHRAVMAVKLAIEDHLIAGMEPPALLWQRGLAIAQMTQALGIADHPVADPCFPDQGQSSALQQYVLIVLSALADPCGMHPGEYALLQRLLARWRNLPKLVVERGSDEKLRWVNLRQLEQPAREALKEPAWLEIGLVRAKLKKRLDALQAGAAPETLHLGKELNAGQWAAFLNRLRRKLREAYRPADAAASQITGEAVFVTSNVEDGFGLISGFRYNANPKAGAAADRVLHERNAIFGRNSIIQDLASERPKLGEEWMFGFEDESGIRISAAVDSVRITLQLGQLVTIMRNAVPQVGKITRVGVRQSGKIEASIYLYPGTPVAAEANALIAGGQIHYPLLLLPAIPETQQPTVAFLINGAQVTQRQTLQLNLHSPRQIQIGPVVDRGPNFEAYRVDPAR